MKQINIQIPEGYVIDSEKSNLGEGKIVFKKKDSTPWRSRENDIFGYYTVGKDIYTAKGTNTSDSMADLFATEKQAKSSQAMAQLSQIIANDERFGGPITDEEWNDEDLLKYIIMRSSDELRHDCFFKHYHFLAFHTAQQRDLFLKENMDLIKQYYMLD